VLTSAAVWALIEEGRLSFMNRIAIRSHDEADPPHAIGLLRSDASGHAAAALPIRVRNSRRLIRLPHSSWTSEQQSGSSTDQNANATSISFRQ